MKFNTNQTYSTRSVCDHNCIWHYLVTKRTNASVWIQELNDLGEPTGEVIRKKIEEWEGNEVIRPQGVFSMAPILRSDGKNLLNPAKIKLQKELIELKSSIEEYQSIVVDLKMSFSGEELKVRLDSLKNEYGSEFLYKRLDKMREQIQAA